jgi:hypothetical protein
MPSRRRGGRGRPAPARPARLRAARARRRSGRPRGPSRSSRRRRRSRRWEPTPGPGRRGNRAGPLRGAARRGARQRAQRGVRQRAQRGVRQRGARQRGGRRDETATRALARPQPEPSRTARSRSARSKPANPVPARARRAAKGSSPAAATESCCAARPAAASRVRRRGAGPTRRAPGRAPDPGPRQRVSTPVPEPTHRKGAIRCVACDASEPASVDSADRSRRRAARSTGQRRPYPNGQGPAARGASVQDWVWVASCVSLLRFAASANASAALVCVTEPPLPALPMRTGLLSFAAPSWNAFASASASCSFHAD